MQTNLEIVQSVNMVFAKGDIPSLLDMCSDDVEVVFCASEPTSIPWAGRRSGKAGVLEYFQLIGAAFDELQWKPSHYVGDGERIVAFGTIDMKVRATGDRRLAMGA
ncbi:MAG: nuclear transport factor 2 family protein [Chloroflexi bacterium]|nr:nuclear transport factor 2 family protein [Chloroflexota bacterium]